MRPDSSERTFLRERPCGELRFPPNRGGLPGATARPSACRTGRSVDPQIAVRASPSPASPSSAWPPAPRPPNRTATSSCRATCATSRTRTARSTRVPVADVKLTVAQVRRRRGRHRHDRRRRATTSSPLPGPGDYTVTIDQSTLPDGVELRDEAQAEVVVNIRPNERQVLNYFLGESATPDRVAAGRSSRRRSPTASSSA